MKQSFPLDQDLLMHHIPGVVYRCRNDKAWTMLYLSEACLTLTGYSPAELLGNNKLTYASIIHPDDRGAVEQSVQTAVQAGKDFRCTYRVLCKSGVTKWVREVGKAVKEDGDKRSVLQGYIVDITAEKNTEEALLESKQSFTQLADAIPLIVWMSGADGITDYTSAAFFNYTGLIEDTDLILSECWRVAIHPADRNMVSAAWRVAIQTGTEYAREYRLLSKDGAYRWHLSHARPIKDQKGNVLKWYGAAVDVHEQRLLLQDARRLANRLVDTLESITDAFITVGHDWRVTYINGTAETFLQVDRDHLIGKDIREEFPDSEVFIASFQKAIDDQTTQLVSAEYKSLGKWFDVRAYPSADGLAIYFRDSTRQRALDERLKETQYIEAVGQLTGGVAHDFNNLLTVIVGNSEILREGLSGDPVFQHLAEMVQEAADRGAKLTQRLLAFSRRQALAPQVIDVSELVGGMEDVMRETLTEAIELKFEFATSAHALIDPIQLEASLLNLCANARDAMPEGGKLTIATSTCTLDKEYAETHLEVLPGNYVMVSLADTGSGIPSAILTRVFDPFFTTKGHAKRSGLGLSMVYGFVKQSQGHISLCSGKDTGTTVKLYLPLTEEKVKNPKEEKAEIVGGVETVLLVEDDDLLREFAILMLGQLGYTVIAAPDGLQALEIVKVNQEFDLLLTDVIMPGGMNGGQLAEAALKLRPDLKVLFMSGYTEHAVLTKGKFKDGVMLLDKPFRRLELALKIREVLDAELEA